MGFLDSSFAGSTGHAKRLIDKYGGTATIYRENAETYDPLTGNKTGGGLDAGTSISTSMMIEVSEKDVDGTTVLRGDYKSYVSSVDIELSRSDIQKAILEFNSVRYKLIEIKPIHSGQQVCAYKAFWRNL